ncbi:hypothetical protein ACFQY8_01020, partial [Alloscardovia venturai]
GTVKVSLVFYRVLDTSNPKKRVTCANFPASFNNKLSRPRAKPQDPQGVGSSAFRFLSLPVFNNTNKK